MSENIKQKIFKIVKIKEKTKSNLGGCSFSIKNICKK